MLSLIINAMAFITKKFIIVVKDLKIEKICIVIIINSFLAELII